MAIFQKTKKNQEAIASKIKEQIRKDINKNPQGVIEAVVQATKEILREDYDSYIKEIIKQAARAEVAQKKE